MLHLSVDLETYSDVDIKKCGLYKYAQSPAFEILLIGFAFNDGPVIVLDLTKPLESIAEKNLIDAQLKAFREALVNPDVIKHAYNATFEITCLNRAGFTTPIDQWRCTMLHGLYCGFPAGLGLVGEAVGLPSDKRKLGIGLSLIRTFCVPQKPTKSNGGRTRVLPEHDPDRWKLFIEYNRQDVVTEREIERRLSSFPVPDREQRLWVLDARMNARGVRVDTKLIEGAIQIGETTTRRLLDEARSISGLDNPKSVKQLMTWLNEELPEEEDLDNLRKATVKELLEKGIQSEAATRMLELRLQLGKTSTKKYDAAANAKCDDDRVRGLIQFYGANRTGRWCLAEGTPVLVKQPDGTICNRPIQAVHDEDRVWDGDSWVNHEGVVFSGEHEVIEWDGVTATRTHIVYVSDSERMTLQEAKKRRILLWKGNIPSIE